MTDGWPADRPPEIDRAVLELIKERLQSAPQIDRAAITTSDGQTKLLAVFAAESTPPKLTRRVLDVRWYTNGDFRIHYQEDWPDRVWCQRWDRHPSTHNERDHFHPPPDAATPGDDRSWPTAFQDMCKHVIDDVRDRTNAIWAANADGD